MISEIHKIVADTNTNTTQKCYLCAMKFYFAPFHGISMRLFREVFLRYFGGFDAVLSPFVAAVPASHLKQSYFSDVYPSQEIDVLIPQLIGNNPQDIAVTAAYLYELGFQRVNLNMGCPMPKIVRKQRACGLMPFPEKVQQILEMVQATAPIKFSIKMRLGWTDKAESLTMLRAIAPYNVDFVVLHARLGTQQYNGIPDWTAFEQCLQIAPCPMVYNGDIFSVEDYQNLVKYFPHLEACMLGRGMLKNPFLLQEIQGVNKSKIEKYNIFADFYQNLWQEYANYYREEVMLNRMKELWKYFSVWYNLSATSLQLLLRVNNVSDFYEQTTKIITLY